MAPKAIALFLFAYLVQGLQCDPLDDVLKEYKPKIRLLQEEIKFAYNDTEGYYATKRAEVRDNVWQGMLEVKRKVSDLKIEADASGKKVCAFKLKVALLGVTPELLRGCYANDDLDAAEREVKTYKVVLKDTAGLIERCVESVSVYGQADDLKVCLDQGINRANQELERKRITVVEALERALRNSGACIERTSAQLDRKIEVIAKNFEECVKGSKW